MKVLQTSPCLGCPWGSPLPPAPDLLPWVDPLPSLPSPRMVFPHLHSLGAGGDVLPSTSQLSAQAITAPPTKRCCDSTATTSRLPWGPAWSPGLGSGTPLDDISGELPTGRANKAQLSNQLLIALCSPGMPGTAWAR